MAPRNANIFRRLSTVPAGTTFDVYLRISPPGRNASAVMGFRGSWRVIGEWVLFLLK
jgi:hypothetical protein